jgi:preprotein translocase subunit Sss1
MAARARGPAAARAAQPPTAEGREGRGWLVMLRGEAPSLDGAVDIFAVLPKLPSFSSLERLGVVLSGDPDFWLYSAWAEELPFPAHGYAVVELASGRALIAIPEEVARRFMEWRGAALPLVFDSLDLDLSLAERLWRLAEELGGRLELLGLEPPHELLDLTAAVIRLPRPPTREEWEEIVRIVRGLRPSPSWCETAVILHGAGLAPLAFMLPSRYIHSVGSDRLEWKPRPSNWQGGFVVLAKWWWRLRGLRPLLANSGLFRETPDGLLAEGSRGSVLLQGENLYAKPVALDRRFFEDAERVLLALERPDAELSDFFRAVAELIGAETPAGGGGTNGG